ncbi:MAG: NAD(P)-dependent oxidoreductase [Bryobacteraceae bacterium]|jgi:3-hydroxyisobutyrate dehydrogenase/2-hydroxy-3-oxopropionate reductase
MANLGFIGLGIMGLPMARNLLRAGHRVALWSHDTSKARKLASEHTNAVFAESPRGVGEQSECVFSCVGTTEMSEAVLAGPDGVIEGARAGTVVADASTVAPSASRAIGCRMAERGIHFLDAPCTGSKPGAEGATLTFMVGGDKDVFERVRPYFEPMGKQFYYCGGPGLGLEAKLTQNLTLANMLLAFNEGMVLATKAGVDPALMVEILSNSAARSGLVSFKAPYILKRDFTTNFSTKWMAKDVGMALDSARQMNIPLPLTGVTQQMFQAAIAEGYGEEDMCSTIKVLENWAGVKVSQQF